MGILVDMVDDLWTIFECPDCGVLFFNETKLASHMKESHDLDYFNINIFSVKMIRAFPRKHVKPINESEDNIS